MQRLLSVSSIKKFANASKPAVNMSVRCFSEKLDISNNFEFQTGPRRQELEAEKEGAVCT
jgi:hypothetical protein